MCFCVATISHYYKVGNNMQLLSDRDCVFLSTQGHIPQTYFQFGDFHLVCLHLIREGRLNHIVHFQYVIYKKRRGDADNMYNCVG